MSAGDVLAEWLHETRLAIEEDYVKQGLKASGRWSRSLTEKVAETEKGYRATLTGEDYTEYMVNGRRPNQNQDPDALRRWAGYMGNGSIAQWVKDKGLSISPFAVAYKIAREGVKVPSPYNDGQFIRKHTNKAAFDELRKRIAMYRISELKTDLTRILYDT